MFEEKTKVYMILDEKKYVNFGVFSGYMFGTTIDFISGDMVMKFKLLNQKDLSYALDRLKEMNIEFVDEKNILDAYYKYSDVMERNKYFQREFMYKQ